MATTQRRETKAELIAELAVAFRANQNAANALDEAASRKLGVNFTDLRCLDIVEQHGRMTAGELAEVSGLTTGAVTAVLDRLETIGYLRRIRDKQDRRRVMIEMTEKAKRDAEEFYGPIGTEWHALLARYPAAELRAMLDILVRGNELAAEHVRRFREPA